MKKKITHDEYLKLLGLASICEHNDQEMALVHAAAAKLIGIDDDPHLDDFFGTRVYDALHGSRGMKQALQLMEIEIEPPVVAPKREYAPNTARAVRLAKQVAAGTPTPSSTTDGLDSDELSALWKEAVVDLHEQLEAAKNGTPDA